MNTNIELRGAELALDEAISKLRRSVHSCACEDGKAGDDVKGKKLADRIGAHMNQINEALIYWGLVLEHYEKMREITTEALTEK